MKKLIPALLILLFISFFASSIKAQEFNYSCAYQDYVYNNDLYRKAHAEYQLKKAQYLQTGTLASREEAQKATAAMLQARDQVVITYLTAIRMKMAETQGIDTVPRETYYSLIDEDAAWYRTHREGISSAASLEDLQKDSDEARARYQSTELTIFKSLTLISNGKIDNFQNKTNELVSKTEGKVNEIGSNGDKDTTNIERWILEVKNRVDRSTDKEVEAWTAVNKLKANDKTKSAAFNQAQVRFAEALQYLKEANSFLKQITTEVKTADN